MNSLAECVTVWVSIRQSTAGEHTAEIFSIVEISSTQRSPAGSVSRPLEGAWQGRPTARGSLATAAGARSWMEPTGKMVQDSLQRGGAHAGGDDVAGASSSTLSKWGVRPITTAAARVICAAGRGRSAPYLISVDEPTLIIGRATPAERDTGVPTNKLAVVAASREGISRTHVALSTEATP
jgi:hypothetical protein